MSADLERAFVDACLLDVTALKPGNVGLHAGGHGMQPVDFIRSAEAAAPAIARPAGTVGERIHRAIVATHEAVGANTNLGIVLLAAPLAHVAWGSPGREALVRRLRACLTSLTVEDARLAFEAIQLARPGGLGTAERHDVHAPARVSLLDAMREARTRRSPGSTRTVADVLDTGRARLAAARGAGATGDGRRPRYLVPCPPSGLARRAEVRRRRGRDPQGRGGRARSHRRAGYRLRGGGGAADRMGRRAESARAQPGHQRGSHGGDALSRLPQ
jgi:hypothetical protein